jgi:hypothetical protein
MGGKEQKFRTKTGYCHILPDKIVFSRTGEIGNLADIVVKEHTSRILIMYGVIAVGLLFSAYTNYVTGNMPLTIVFGGIGLMLVNGIVRSINFSGTPLINRSDIQNVLFKKGIWGISRARFEVIFKDSKGNLRKRLILLPGTISVDEETITKATKIMVDTGVMNPE